MMERGVKPPRVLAVVVLYKRHPERAQAFVTLRAAIQEYQKRGEECQIALYDNSPDSNCADDLPEGVFYESGRNNPGLAVAYNWALERAQSSHCEWLLTLDQDTSLPLDYLVKLGAHAERLRGQQEVGAIVPQVFAGTRRLSPNWFLAGAWPRFYRAGYVGIPESRTFAFNSGSLLRVQALQAVGGYDPRFWLDYCDAYLFCKLHKHGFKVFIAGDTAVQHQFSMLDFKNSVSLARYQNIVKAGSAFWDLEMNLLGQMDHNGRLLFRVLKHLLRADQPAFLKVTLRELQRRLLQSKERRLAAWEEDLRQEGRLRTEGDLIGPKGEEEHLER